MPASPRLPSLAPNAKPEPKEKPSLITLPLELHQEILYRGINFTIPAHYCDMKGTEGHNCRALWTLEALVRVENTQLRAELHLPIRRVIGTSGCDACRLLPTLGLVDPAWGVPSDDGGDFFHPAVPVEVHNKVRELWSKSNGNCALHYRFKARVELPMIMAFRQDDRKWRAKAKEPPTGIRAWARISPMYIVLNFRKVVVVLLGVSRSRYLRLLTN
jgi:hypothetical protein